MLMAFECETFVVREWFALAFQNDDAEIKFFIDNLTLRCTHFREVRASLVTEKEG